MSYNTCGIILSVSGQSYNALGSGRPLFQGPQELQAFLWQDDLIGMPDLSMHV